MCTTEASSGLCLSHPNEKRNMMKTISFLPLTAVSPYVRYMNDIVFKSPSVHANRIIYDHEFIFALKGEADFLLDGERLTIREGEMIYIRPNVPNQMRVESGKPFHANCIHFDWFPPAEQYNFTAEQFYLRSDLTQQERMIVERLRERPDYEVSELFSYPILRSLDMEVLRPLLSRLFLYAQKRDAYGRMKSKGIFLEIIAELYSAQFTENGAWRTHAWRKPVNDAIEYMKLHYAQPLTVSVLARRCALSSKYFGTIFKQVTGQPVYVCLTEIRMQNARELLLHSDLSISEVAQMVGISDVYYFTRLFKKTEGITPGRYRRMLQEPTA